MAIPTYEGVTLLGFNPGTSITPDISTIDGGSPPSDGDLLIAHLGVLGSAATAEYQMTPPADWHHICGAQNSLSSAVYWKIWRTGDDTTPTFSQWPSNTGAIAIHCIRGADQARPIARHSIDRGVNVSSWDWLAETTPVADCLALATGVVDDAAAGFTPATGWTERVDGALGTFSMYAQTQGFASASSSTGTASISRAAFGADDDICHMIVVQPPQVARPKDVQVRTGTSTSPTSTGNQDITGLGFDVKALIVYCGNINSDGVTADLEYMRGIGADDGVTAAAQRSVGVWHDSGTTTDQGYSDNGSIIKMYFTGNTTLGSPDLEATFSRITDGFRLNWTAVQGTGVVFNWIALGGSDLQAVVGAVQASAGAVSGLPWRPDMVHTNSQCIDSDSDQTRAFALMSCGWLDCQAGGQFAAMVDLDAGASAFIVRHTSFVGQVSAGGLTWSASFEQTASDGWSWAGSNADYFQYLALYFGNHTAFPYQVENLEAAAAGAAGADQVVPAFADGQTHTRKQLVHMIGCDGGMATTQGDGQISEGHVSYAGRNGVILDQDCIVNARAGNTSERNRKPDDIFVGAALGDINSPGKVGRFIDEDTIDWSVNSGGGYNLGIATIGAVDDGYPVFFAAL